jgi:predicted Zn-dependent peptidase
MIVSLLAHVWVAGSALAADDPAPASPPPAAARPIATAGVVHTLPNGLRVILEEDHRTDRVALHIKYGVGARDEGAGEHGCAHLFEHLMFEGSRNVGNNQFDTWLTAAGGWNNAFTSEDQTAYYMGFPSGALDLGLFLESDRLGFLDAGLDEANLKNQQGVVLQERYQGYANPHGRDWDAVNRLLFTPDHPYHVPVIGTVADIEGFSLDAVRGFWSEHYRPRNAVLVLVGNFESEAALAQITHWFSDVPDRGPATERGGAWAGAHGSGDGYLEDDVEDRTVYAVWPTVPLRHPDMYALDVLAGVLSGGHGTRLDDALYYDSKLATDASASAYNSEIDGLWVAYATSNKTKLPALVGAIDKTLATILSEPPRDEELNRARTAYVHALRDQTTDPLSRARMMADCLAATGEANCVAADVAAYQAVRADDVVRVAKTYLTPDRRVTLSVVPKGDKGFLPGATLVELP